MNTPYTSPKGDVTDAELPPLPPPYLCQMTPDPDSTPAELYFPNDMREYGRLCFSAGRTSSTQAGAVELTNENVIDLVCEAGLDWHAGFDLNEENRYGTLVQLAFNLGKQGADTSGEKRPNNMVAVPCDQLAELQAEARRYLAAVGHVDLAEALYAAVLNNGSDTETATVEFDEAIQSSSAEGGKP